STIPPPGPYEPIVAMFRGAAMARVAAERGELVEALELARQAVEVANQTEQLNSSARVWAALAEVLLKCGRDAEAADALATAIGIYERKGNVAAVARLGAVEPTAAPVSTPRPSR